MKLKLFLALTLLLFFSSISFGQTATTGALRGTIKSTDGELLPGILVTVTSPSIVMKQMTTVSNENGVYRFMGLLPGKYELKYELEGMTTVIRKGIVVVIGKTMSVDIQMSLKSIHENIIVEGKAPTIDRQSTTGAKTMDLEFLKLIPISGRQITNYFNMTPGVTGDTAHGSSNRDNAFQLDGVNVNDPARGDDYVQVSPELLAEVSVQTGGITAEQGNVRGAVINAVTKSGGNKLHGMINLLYNHESLQADNTKGTDLYDPDATTKVGEKFKLEPGFTLGGPVIKDKLWFFTALSYSTRETYAPGFPHDKAEGADDLPSDRKDIQPFVKLTYQPSQSDKFTVSYQYFDRIMNNRDAHWSRNEATTMKQKMPQHVINARWTKSFGSNFYANLKVGIVKHNMELTSKQIGTQYVDLDTSFATGSYWRNLDGNIRNRFQVNLDATTFIDDFIGSHEFKFGAELADNRVNWTIRTASNENHNDLTYVMTYPSIFGDPGYFVGYYIYGYERKDTIRNFSAFIQDTWSVADNLTLTLGLRYERQQNIWPKQNLDEEPFIFAPATHNMVVDRRMTESITALDWSNFSPRLGLIYDMFNDGTTLLKASWGRYTSQVMTEIANTAHPNGWYGYSLRLHPVTGAPITGTETIWNVPSTTNVGHPDKKLTAPYVNELTLGIERELWEDWSFGLRYIKKWDRNLVENVDASQLNIDKLISTGELEWIDYETVTLFDPVGGNNVTFYNDMDEYRVKEEYIMNPEGATRDYDGIEVTVRKRFSKNWAMDLSYVYNHSRGYISTSGNGAFGRTAMYSDPNAHINNEGRFPFSRPHQLKLNLLFKGPLGINIGSYFRYLSGQRYTRQVSSYYLGSENLLNQDDNVFINAEKRGSSHYPDFYQLDLRLEKSFKFSGINLSIFAEMFNVFNSNMTVAYKSLDSSDTRAERYLYTTDIIDPRVVRMGAKIEF